MAMRGEEEATGMPEGMWGLVSCQGQRRKPQGFLRGIWVFWVLPGAEAQGSDSQKPGRLKPERQIEVAWSLKS